MSDNELGEDKAVKRVRKKKSKKGKDPELGEEDEAVKRAGKRKGKKEKDPELGKEDETVEQQVEKKEGEKDKDSESGEEGPKKEADDELYDPIRNQTHCQQYFYIYLLSTIIVLISVTAGFSYYMYRRFQRYGFYYGITFKELPTTTTTTISPTASTTPSRRPWQTYYGLSSASCLSLSHYVLTALFLVLFN